MSSVSIWFRRYGKVIVSVLGVIILIILGVSIVRRLQADRNNESANQDRIETNNDDDIELGLYQKI
jgi:flagellar biogenesis protein FliO